MALLIPPGYAQILVGIQHEFAPRPFAVTFGCDVTDAGGDLEAVGTLVGALLNVSGGIAAEMDSSLTISTIVVRGGSDGGVGPTVEVSANIEGGTVGETPPVNTALLVRKVTSLGGRRNRGRFYWPGLLADANVSELGQVQEARVTALQSDFTAFLDGLASGGSGVYPNSPMVVLHDASEGAVLPTPVQSLVVQSTAATQRRRMRR